MSSRIQLRVAKLASAATGALMLSGCMGLGGGGDTTEAGSTTTGAADSASLDCRLPAGATAIAASARADSAAATVTPAVRWVLERAVTSGQHVAVVSTDGVPTVLQEGQVVLEAKNDTARAQEQDKWTAGLASTIESSKAKAAEADPLGALDVAARSVHAHGDEGTVVLMDSGLQTAGALRYQEPGMLLASGRDLVSYLESTHQLPDLSGLVVVLSGIGETSSPQQRLDSATHKRLLSQWTAIAKASGAECVAVDDQPRASEPVTGAPRVTNVDVPEVEPLRLEPGRTLALREDSVAFADNSAALLDAAAATRSLTDLADQIGGRKVRLVGTTASYGTEAGRQRLSQERAEAVKTLLVNLGVDASQIVAKGVGTHYKGHVDDVRPDGSLVPALAARNRAVFVEVVG